MIKMLEQVVLDGTGTDAIIPGYSVAGKTGTATIPMPGQDKLTNNYNASFVGFAPASDPILSMIVVIERPLNDDLRWIGLRARLSTGDVVRAAPLRHSL
jgi:stage V sporulation protein D (sporulation-specific penicillin-binding protein)